MLTFKQYLRKRIDACGPRTRFFVFKLVIMTGRPFDTAILQRLAVELEQRGALDLAVDCWHLIHRLTPYASDGLIDHLQVAVASGEMARVHWFTEQARREVGLPPGQVVWLAGMLASHGHYGEAGRVLASLGLSADEAHRLVSRFPSIIVDDAPKDLQRLSRDLECLASAPGSATNAPLLELARLCFTFRKLELAAQLYRGVAARHELPMIDSIAMWYVGARSSGDMVIPGPDEVDLARALEHAMANPDASAMLAFIALASDEDGLAATAIRHAIRGKYGGLDACEAIEADCLAMFGVVAGLRDNRARLPPELLEDPDVGEGREGVPKVFVCGFGWSGSGAVYDEIRGVPGFSEFEGAGDAPLLNADSDSEPTFIQADAGLGDSWKVARATGRMDWQRLWDMLCLHVLGLSGIGYNDYKSCAAAANNVRRHGALYTGPFRDFFEGYAALLRTPVSGGLTGLFADTTESLCRMLLEQTGGKAVLFNNAVFGREAEMLQLFRSCRAVVVFRDPLDVYADRKRQDKNHWRSPRLLADLYGRSLQRYVDYRTGEKGIRLENLREVPFERFIMDPGFRRQVREWLLAGIVVDAGKSYLDPAASSRNIGMHGVFLDAEAREQMRPITATYCDMQRLAEQAWGVGEAGGIAAPI